MQEWWRGAVIYQIYPRSFQDTSGNGIGDLAGITQHLPHIARLGADAVWLSPVFPSPMKDMGYDVSDYTGIDPLFGTLEDFDTLLAGAHDLGLKVIIDQVLSHTSDQHPWFGESRRARDGAKADWYVWADPEPDGAPPNNWASVFGGSAWEWEPRRRQYYLHNFLIEQPDLNFHNREVQDALLETMRFWLERGVDGFRLDTVNFYFHDPELRDNPPNPDIAAARSPADTPAETYGWQQHVFSKNRPENIAFLERLRALTDLYEARMMVGEVGDAGETGLRIMGQYSEGDGRLHMCYNFEMLSPDFSAGHFRQTIETFQKYAPEGWPSWSFSNHDVMRHVSRWGAHARDRGALAHQAVALLMAFEGSVGIYQGEELGLPETELEYSELTDPPGLRFWPEVKGRDGCRTPMVWERAAEHGGFSSAKPWLPVKAPALECAADGQVGVAGSMFEAYRAAIAFRKASPALLRGTTRFHDLPEPVLAFERIDPDQRIACIFNLSPGPVALDVLGETRPVGPGQGAQLAAGRLTLAANGFAYLETGGAGLTLALV